MNIAKDVVSSIKDASKSKTSAYDTQATVTRIEGDTAWVHIPGGVNETPVQLTVNASEGDAVQVRVANGTAWITGNASAPPTDDKKANIAYTLASTADEEAQTAHSAAQSAVADAGVARQAAEQAQAAVAEIEDDITGLNTRLTTAEGNITTIEGNITSLGTRVSTAEGNITAIEGDIDDIESDVSGLSSRVGTAEGKVTTLEGNVTNLQGRVTTAESDITAVEGDITTLQGRVDDAEETVDGTLRELSVAQDVVGTINWITNHGTMTNQTGQAFDENQVYFVVDTNGDYLVGGTRYAVVPEPVASDINSYYVLSISESVQNYVATHIVVDSEGLWIIPDSGGNKVLIATGSGSTYTTAGTYIVSGSTILASFTSTGAVIGQNVSGKSYTSIDADGMRVYRNANGLATQLVNLGYGPGVDEQGGTSDAPYFDIGVRNSGQAKGNFSCTVGAVNEASGYASVAFGENNAARGSASVAEGFNTKATNEYAHSEGQLTEANGYASHAEGYANYANGDWSHAEGANCRAAGGYAHAGGNLSTASGDGSFAHGLRAYAASDYQTAIGQCNVIDSNDTYAVIVGNGADYNNRSNALTVDWSGNVVASGDVTDGNGNVLDDKADASALANYLPLTGGTLTGALNGTDITASGDITSENAYLQLDTSATTGTDKEIYDALVSLGWDSDVIV